MKGQRGGDGRKGKKKGISLHKKTTEKGVFCRKGGGWSHDGRPLAANVLTSIEMTLEGEPRNDPAHKGFEDQTKTRVWGKKAPEKTNSEHFLRP